MSSSKIFTLLFGLTVLNINAEVRAGEQLPAPPSRAIQFMAAHDINAFNNFMNAPWTDNDKPYAVLRASIEQYATTGPRALRLMERYQSQLVLHPDNHQLQFAYGYAAYLAWVKPGGLNHYATPYGAERRYGLDELYSDICRTPYPHTYNVARLAFLSGVQTFPRAALKNVGIRLMGKDPEDAQVVYGLISVLLTTRSPADTSEAVNLADALVRQYPAKASVYARLASVHYAIWRKSKSPKEANEALSSYRKYLDLASPSDPFRAQAQTLINQLQNGQ